MSRSAWFPAIALASFVGCDGLPDALSATVNGVVVQEDGPPPPKGLVTTPDLRVGFGGYIDENFVSIRFRDVELRRLAAGSGGR